MFIEGALKEKWAAEFIIYKRVFNSCFNEFACEIIIVDEPQDD